MLCNSSRESDAWILQWTRLLTHRGRDKISASFQTTFWNSGINIWISISPKFVLKGPTNSIPALVQIMAWRRSGDQPLSEPMMVSLLTHICVTRPQWVNCSCNSLPTDCHQTELSLYLKNSMGANFVVILMNWSYVLIHVSTHKHLWKFWHTEKKETGKEKF